MKPDPSRDTMHTLQGYGFTVEDKRPERDYFIVACPTCHSRWSLTNPDKPSVGTLLKLLNHARGHKDD